MSRWFAAMTRGSEAREIIQLWECHWGEHISYLPLPPSCLLFLTAASYQSGLCKQCGRPYPIPREGKEVALATFKGDTKKVLFHVSTPSREHSNSGGNKLVTARLMEEGKGTVIIYYQVAILRSYCKLFIFPQFPFLGTPSLTFNAIQNLRDHQLPVLN